MQRLRENWLCQVSAQPSLDDLSGRYATLMATEGKRGRRIQNPRGTTAARELVLPAA